MKAEYKTTITCQLNLDEFIPIKQNFIKEEVNFKKNGKKYSSKNSKKRNYLPNWKTVFSNTRSKFLAKNLIYITNIKLIMEKAMFLAIIIIMIKILQRKKKSAKVKIVHVLIEVSVINIVDVMKRSVK